MPNENIDKAVLPGGKIWNRNLNTRFMNPALLAMRRDGVSKYDFTGIEGALHIDKRLTGFSLRYSNGTMVGDSICPRVPVMKETDKYVVYGRQNFRLNQSIVRKDAADPNYVDAVSYTDSTYVTEEYELADLIGDRARANTDDPINLDIDKQANLTEKLMLYREKRIADLYTAAGAFATTDPVAARTGGVDILADAGAAYQWDYSSGGTSYDSNNATWNIEAVIDRGKQAIMDAIGKDPNVCIMPRKISRVVKKDARVRSQIQYNPDPWNKILTDGELPDTLWNMQLFEPSCIYDSSEEGQTFSGTSVWGNAIVLLYLAPSPMQIRTVSAGMTFQKDPRIVKKWREEPKKADAIEVFENVVEKIISPYCGYVIWNPIGNF